MLIRVPVYSSKLVPVEVYVWLKYTILFPTKYKILQITTGLLTKAMPECLNYNVAYAFKDDKWPIERRINFRREPFSKYGSTISKSESSPSY